MALFQPMTNDIYLFMFIILSNINIINNLHFNYNMYMQSILNCISIIYYYIKIKNGCDEIGKRGMFRPY